MSYDENSFATINEVEDSIAESTSPKAHIKKRSNTNLIINEKPEVWIECDTQSEKQNKINNERNCNKTDKLKINNNYLNPNEWKIK